MKTVIGVFDSKDNAESAIRCLKDASFNLKDLSVLMKESKTSPGQTKQEYIDSGKHLGNAAVTGLTTGAVVGGLAGLLIGLGTLIIPGTGGILVAGPLALSLGLTGAAAATASGAITGAVAGSLLGVLMELGVPKEKAQQYQQKVQQGAVLLAVPTADEREPEAREIMQDHFATDITAVKIPFDIPQNSIQPNPDHTYYQPLGTYQYQPVGAKGGMKDRVSRHMQEKHSQSLSEKIEPQDTTQTIIDIE